ncbi:MAG: DUF1189 domain-containing protein [Lachnospiraceae bacterium]|nr:DUF1189 domain-containing protein [Lachnospiraceae bacterium]
MNIFYEMFYSITGTKHYPEFLKNKKVKVILYVVVITLIYFAIAHVRTIPSTIDLATEVREAVMDFPDFELKSGKLEIEEAFYYDESNLLVMMESEYGSYIRESSESDWREMLYDYDTVFIADETTVLLKSDGEINIYDYPDDFQLSRDWVYDKIDYIYVIMVIYLVFAYLFSFMGYFLAALFVALAGMIMCSFMNQKLTFGQLYLLSLYAKTLPLFVKGLLKAINLSFFGFFILTFAIACLYVGFAIHNMDLQDEENRRIDGPVIF